MTTEELRESLLAAPKNGYARITVEQRAEMESYCKRYMAFMDACKTEREATDWAIAEAEKHGFKAFVPGISANPGDKIYYNCRGKAIALAVIGTESLAFITVELPCGSFGPCDWSCLAGWSCPCLPSLSPNREPRSPLHLVFLGPWAEQSCGMVS